MSNSAGGFSRIAVGIDFSSSSLHALDVARTRFPEAELRLLHAVDVRVTASPDVMGGLTPMSYDPALLDTIEQGDAQQLTALVREGESYEQLVGDPVTSLLDAAQAWGADLLIVGTHARGPLEHLFLGSTAEKLVARSPVPVLTVRQPNPEPSTGGMR
ncbi:universal stress protein [Deinococcus piscis]|uniref:Universal stress protein n=1 Tax=Deinococcus piscis TaxID=394230 RepID=A0ABQ3K4Y0_9DEIO|nr:universal stress protein [Deinococcus piscis]GHF95502.1 universal stress protein [Deinococcus piscis]